jgi:hypothetical protein
LRHGQLSVTRFAGDAISINGPGGAVIRSQTMADVNATQGAVAGKSWKKTVSTAPVKGQRYPFYYGVHPTGRYPDQPFVRDLYYDGANAQLLISGAKPVPVPVPEPVRPLPPPVIGIDTNCLQCAR